MEGVRVDQRLTGDSICKERFEVPPWQNLIWTQLNQQPNQRKFESTHSIRSIRSLHSTEHTELTQHTHTEGSHSSVAFQAEFPQLRALSTSIPTHGHLPWMEEAQFLNQDMYEMSSVPSHCVPSVQSGSWHSSRFLSSFSSDVFFVFLRSSHSSNGSMMFSPGSMEMRARSAWRFCSKMPRILRCTIIM